MGLSGLVGAGAAEGLEQILTRQLLQQQQAERERAQRAQEAAQQQRISLDTRSQDFEERVREEDVQQDAIGDMRAQGEKRDARMTRLQDEEDKRSKESELADELAKWLPTAPNRVRQQHQANKFGITGTTDEDFASPEEREAEGKSKAAQIGREAEARAAAEARHRAPSGGGTKEQTWVTRGGKVVPIEKGTAQPGDTPYDAVHARQTQPVDSADAQAVTRTALGLARRLKDDPGIDAATGAYELRGFTQGAVDFNSVRNQLVAALALPNLGALRGPMSDKDILFVKQLATRLENPRISKAETLRAIEEADLFLSAKLQGESPTPPPEMPGGGAAPRRRFDANGREVK